MSFEEWWQEFLNKYEWEVPARTNYENCWNAAQYALNSAPIEEHCDCTEVCLHNSPHCMMEMTSEKLARIAKLKLLQPLQGPLTSKFICGERSIDCRKENFQMGWDAALRCVKRGVREPER